MKFLAHCPFCKHLIEYHNIELGKDDENYGLWLVCPICERINFSIQETPSCLEIVEEHERFDWRDKNG